VFMIIITLHFFITNKRTSTARLDETERLLSTVTSERHALLAALGEVKIDDAPTFEVKESRSGDSQAVDWIVEKKSMERRMDESDKALVLLAKENEDLMTKISMIEKENADLKRGKEEDGLSTELLTLKQSFSKEKKKHIARQQELEGLLIEALKSRYGGESNEVILKKLGEAQLEVVRGVNK
jgi:hypothetical protein